MRVTALATTPQTAPWSAARVPLTHVAAGTPGGPAAAHAVTGTPAHTGLAAATAAPHPLAAAATTTTATATLPPSPLMARRSAGAADDAGGPTAGTGAPPARLDIQEIARQVQRTIERQAQLERERKGLSR
jgi:hypothetical protein